MKIATARVVQVKGKCNAKYKIGDEIKVSLENACLIKNQSSNLCIFAISAILSNMSRITHGQKIYASCPDPATGLGGNVVFKITKGELS